MQSVWIGLDWIGRLFAFASVTNTRMLAVRGDPSWPTYELWFSFIDDNEKRRFINLVRDDRFADPSIPTVVSVRPGV
jgi:hypothetical protein